MSKKKCWRIIFRLKITFSENRLWISQIYYVVHCYAARNKLAKAIFFNSQSLFSLRITLSPFFSTLSLESFYVCAIPTPRSYTGNSPTPTSRRVSPLVIDLHHLPGRQPAHTRWWDHGRRGGQKVVACGGGEALTGGCLRDSYNIFFSLSS